jgi:predicted phosphodiesterase
MYLPRLRRQAPDAQVIVFGHIHRPINVLVDGQLIFNPGSPHFTDHASIPRCIGILRVDSTGRVTGEHITLPVE